MSDNFELDSLPAEALAQLDKICSNLFPNKTLNDSEKLDLAEMESRTNVVRFTVSVKEGRQLAQFIGNDYFLSAEIDMTGVWDYIKTTLAKTSTRDRLTRYFELKDMFQRLFKLKYLSTEHVLRDLLSQAEAKDGIRPMGRFAPQDKAPR